MEARDLLPPRALLRVVLHGLAKTIKRNFTDNWSRGCHDDQVLLDGLPSFPTRVNGKHNDAYVHGTPRSSRWPAAVASMAVVGGQ